MTQALDPSASALPPASPEQVAAPGAGVPAYRPPAHSIRRHLSRVLAIQTAIFLSVVAGLAYMVSAMQVAEKQVETLNTHMTVVEGVCRKVAERGGESAVVAVLRQYVDRRPGTWMVLQHADGTELYRDPAPGFAMDGRHVTRFQRTLETPGLYGGQVRATMWMDTSADAETLQRLALWLLATVIAGGLLAWAASAWRVRLALAPLNDLAAQTRSIDADRLGRRVRLSRPVQELQPGIDQFNALLERLERAYAQLDSFNADVAHELRTPLTALIVGGEVALSRVRSADELRETLASGLEELQRMSALVNDMLFLASADRGKLACRARDADIAELARQVVEFHEASLEEASVGVRIEGSETVAVDAPLLKRAMSNLMCNATRYARPDSTIFVRVESLPENRVRLAVENEGPPIAREHLPRLFDRFFRADAARPGAEGPAAHFGLGLSIVAAIARMHGGEPWAESEGGRTRIGLTLQRRTGG